jgi:hypothetical protein
MSDVDGRNYIVNADPEAESLARKKQTFQYHQSRPNTSTLPEVRLRKKSAPNAPVDYMTHNGT